MIRQLTEQDLFACLAVFHRGYETIAREFGLTEDNCPDRGRASLPYEKLLRAFEGGALLYGYFDGDTMVGHLGMRVFDGVVKLDDIVVLPEFRGGGIGQRLLDFTLTAAREAGAEKIRLGMIDDNARLKKWYEQNGFMTVECKKYDGAPFTVGYMERRVR